MNRFVWGSAALFAVVLSAAWGLAAAQVPQPTLGARDVFTEFKLPPLKDHPGDEVWRSARKLQVMERAQRLGLHASSATEAWKAAARTYELAKREMQMPGPPAPVSFGGALASQLNAELARPDVTAVVVTSPEIQVDTPIVLNRSDIRLDLQQSKLRAAGGIAYMVRIEGGHDVHVSGGEFVAGNWAVLVHAAHGVTIAGVNAHDLAGGGVAIVGADDVVLWGNQMRGLHEAPVLLNGNTHHVTVAENHIVENLGSSNWAAGVVLTDRNANLAVDPADLLAPDGYWVKPQPMMERLRIPQDNVIVDNEIVGNGSSGIYSDGSVRNVFAGNRIERNSKEGICLDYGSTADVVAWNLFRGNGRRWGKSDEELKKEFVFGLGRLPDGSSPSKVPAISLDNAVFNQVMFNEADENYGGGVKMVRTSLYNVIGLNLLTDDNSGQNPRFHFFGIELGAAPADAPSVELDFTPSRGNIVFGNTIRGNHYAGIFFADGSDRNNVFDNSIFGAEMWAMESVRAQQNYVLNNLTNLRLRNINSGLDPALLKLGAGVFDAPRPGPSSATEKH